ncbi:MAG: PepSY-associated TM helix domain-containing protein [Pseudohongiella sp.]|uniref:PepSY-associated TM helix domain-containing protein n=1 Tax=Pseudohongiella sp. TaxID=1979412 RepID=UPI0034A05DAE
MSRRRSDSRAATPAKAGFRQTMTWLHTWVGLTFIWLLFFVFVTGTAGYFDTEIDRWMQPELPPAQIGVDASDSVPVLLNHARLVAPGAEQWFLSLPVDRNQPYASLFWRGADPEQGAQQTSGNALIDLRDGAVLQARDTGGGQLLYQMHWRLHYLSRNYSDWIITLATMFMFVAIIAGVIIHKRIFRDFFTFRPGKGQRSWLDAHNLLSVAALPFHLMITYSGLLFMGFSFMPLVYSAYYGTDNGARGEFFAEVFDPPGLTAAAGEAAPLVSLALVVAEAEQHWGENRVRSLDIRHPGDANARIFVHENAEQTVANSEGLLVFDGSNGSLIHALPSATSTTKRIRDVSLGLHEGLFAAPVLRWLYFFSGVLGTGMVATGMVMWTVKRREQAVRTRVPPSAGLLLVEKLNVGTIAGLFVGIAAYFWANRLLPVDFVSRADWEAHALFLTWAAMLLHAAVRPTRQAWVEQFALGGLAFAALPVLNWLTTDRHLGQSVPAQDWVLAGFDLTVLALGLTLLVIAGYLASRLGYVNRHLPHDAAASTLGVSR